MPISRTDRLILIYPIIYYAAITALLYFMGGSWQAWNSDQGQLAAIITFIILGNFAHNFLSIWQIARLTAFKAWAKEYRFCGMNIWQVGFITYLLFLIITILLPYGYDTFRPPADNTIAERIVIFIFVAINIHHSLAQTQGIGISFSHKYIKNKEVIASLTKKEKFLYYILFFDWLLFLGPYLIFKATFTFEYHLYRNLILGVFYVWILSAYIKLPRQESTIKILFFLRYAYRFFFTLHPAVAFLGFGLHGGDAMLFYWNSVDKEEEKRRKFLKLEFLFLFIMLGGLYIFCRKQQTIAANLNMYILPSLFLTHYIIEGFMYRMQNPVTHKHISKIM